jgi:hypothetical protein
LTTSHSSFKYKRMLRISALALLLAAPCSAAWNERGAYRATEKSLGQDGIEVLERRGYLVTAGDKKGRRLLYVHWDGIEVFERAAPALRSLLQLHEVTYNSPTTTSSPDVLAHLKELQILPTGGVLSPAIHATIDLLVYHLIDVEDLPPKAVFWKTDALYDLPWGAAFRARTHAELVPEGDSLAADYFSRVLMRSPGASKPAQHLLSYMKAVHGEDLATLLEQDRASGKLSADVKLQIGRYLSDQRRLWNFRHIRKRLRKLQRASTLKRDLKDIRTLIGNMGLETELRTLILAGGKENLEKVAASFALSNIQVLAPEGREQADTGDDVTVSMEFEIAGLSENEKTEVTVAGLIDLQRWGTAQSRKKTSRFKGAGPHPFSVRVPITVHGPVTYRILLSAPNVTPLQRDVTLSVSPDYHTAISLSARAENHVAACRLKPAATAYKHLSAKLEPWASKDRFSKLLADVKKRATKNSVYIKKFSQLAAAADSARLFATPEQCQYRTDRARAAIDLLESLPPGCGQELVSSDQPIRNEIAALLALTRYRARQQAAFTEALTRARDFEARCEPSEAAKAYAEGLAVLSADPAARCGTWRAQYNTVQRIHLPRAQSSGRISGEISKALGAAQKAFAQGHYRKASKILNSLIGGIDGMASATCFSTQRKKASQLAEAVGVALGPLPAKALGAVLGEDRYEAQARRLATRLRKERVLRKRSIDRLRQQQRPSTAGGTR